MSSATSSYHTFHVKPVDFFERCCRRIIVFFSSADARPSAEGSSVECNPFVCGSSLLLACSCGGPLLTKFPDRCAVVLSMSAIA